MAKLIYASNMSLDGWTEDEHGAVDWAPPDDDVFVVITELMRSAGTYLYGRRMYETMAVWETDATLGDRSDLRADFASAWQAADKVVYSSTLAAPPTANTRLERHFDPGAVRDLKAAAEQRSVGRWPEPGSPGPRRRTGRRVGRVRLASRPRWAQPRIAARHTRRSRAHRRAPVRQRRHPPPLSRSVAHSVRSPTPAGPRSRSPSGSDEESRALLWRREAAIVFVEIDDVRAFALTLPRAYEAVVRDGSSSESAGSSSWPSPATRPRWASASRKPSGKRSSNPNPTSSSCPTRATSGTTGWSSGSRRSTSKRCASSCSTRGRCASRSTWPRATSPELPEK